MASNSPPLVKVVSKTGNLPRQLPVSQKWGNIRFTFEKDARAYDWFVVYDDIPAPKPFKFREEKLACPPQNSILYTHEPSVVKTHGSGFVNQFAAVLTCHEEWAMSHSNKIAIHPASPWWYDIENSSYESLKQATAKPKSDIISTICSSKRQSHTLHYRRYHFTRALKAALPTLDWFGHGERPIKDKKTALDSYCYHVVVENHLCPHYWTEKLADAFLGFTLPFYCGCPNAADYFPPDSFIPIDINTPATVAQTIKEAIATDEYSRRLPAILEARRRVLDTHNFFAVIARHIETAPVAAAAAKVIYSRRKLITKRPLLGVKYMWEKHNNRRYARRLFSDN